MHTAPRMTPTERTTLLGLPHVASPTVSDRSAVSVLDDAGKVVTRARVSLVQNSYQDGQWYPIQGRREETDQDGRYLFKDVRAGEYLVVVEPSLPAGGRPPDAETYTTVFYPGSAERTPSTLIALDRNQDLWTIRRVACARADGPCIRPDCRR